MRRREAREGVPWLFRMEGDPPDGLLPGGMPPYLSEAEAMHTLNQVYDLVIECAEHEGIFMVVTRPLRRHGDPFKPRVAASYTGVNLARILNQAVCDYEDMRDDPRVAELRNREYVRRVASGRKGGPSDADSGGPVAFRPRGERPSAQRRGSIGAARIDSDI